MRRRPEKGKRILLCPQCRSAEITLIAGQVVGQVYHCPRCNYLGSLVFETEVDANGNPIPEPE